MTHVQPAPDPRKGLDFQSFNAVLDVKFRDAGDEIAVYFPEPASDPDADFVWKGTTWRELESAVAVAATAYAQLLPARAAGEEAKTVAMVGESGLSYLVTELALFRLGHTAVLLSLNNSTAAQVHLVKVTSTALLLYSPAQRAACEQVVDALAADGYALRAQAWQSVTQEALNSKVPASCPRTALSPAEEATDAVLIVHSSGTTGHPKPVQVLHRVLVLTSFRFAATLRADTLSTLPMVHAWGQGNIMAGLLTGSHPSMIPQNAMLSPRTLVRSMRACPARKLIAVPHTLKLLSESQEGLELLRSYDGVVTGGSPLPNEVGEKLTRAGVKLIDSYGASEFGVLMSSYRDFDTDKGYNVLRLLPDVPPDALAWEPHGDDMYELVVQSTWRGLNKSNRDDGSYATSDLFKKVGEGRWLFVSRTDDTLVHTNGEKSNPVPMEMTIKGSEHVRDAMVVGAHRGQTGVIVILSELAEAKIQEGAAADAMSLIWPAIALANESAPSHSRIIPELVRFLPSSAQFPMAGKKSLIRPKAVLKYKEVIDEMYSAYEGHAADGGEAKIRLFNLDEGRKVIREIVLTSVESRKRAPGDNEDLFDYGIDSLTATRIHNAIKRKVDVPAERLTTMLVFENPTINKLAGSLVRGDGKAGDADGTARVLELLAEYTEKLAALPVGPEKTGQERRLLVLTGATGSLGAHLVSKFAADDRWRLVCLCRAKDDGHARERLGESLAERGLDLPAESLEAVVCYASDLASPRLGLSDAAYEHLVSETAAVVHCGYPVNFNMGLESFNSSIQGAVNLMALAGAAHATFYFCSSVSTVLAQKEGSDGAATLTIPESFTNDPHDAMAMGYAQSKWIVENLCARAHESKGLDTFVFRIGQMIGDTVNGIWNTKEAVPLLIKAGQVMACLPAPLRGPGAEKINWLPVDTAAWMIHGVVTNRRTLDDARSDEGLCHIVHKECTTWPDVYAALRASGLHFEEVPPSEWVDRLRKEAEAASKADRNDGRIDNPAIKLLQYFESVYGRGTQGRAPQKQFETRGLEAAIAVDGSSTLADVLKSVDAELVGKMVRAWQKTGFLK